MGEGSRSGGDPANQEGGAAIRDDHEHGDGRDPRHTGGPRPKRSRRTRRGRTSVHVWIHQQDFISAIEWLIAHDDIDGIVNVASPNPLPNSDFMQILRHEAGVPFGLTSTKWMLAIGAVLMRTETELILKSRRVVPGRLIDGGFVFRYPRWEEAAHDLVAAWYRARAGTSHAA